MKLPFPNWTLNADATIYVSELNKYGEQVKTEVFSGRVNHVTKSKQVLNAQRELVLLSGVVIVPGDVEIDLDATTYVLVCEVEKRVFSINKPSNPDGSVFSTEFLLQ